MGQLKEVISFHCPFGRKFLSDFLKKLPRTSGYQGKKNQRTAPKLFLTWFKPCKS
jgi:hypothetical protein